MFDLVVECLLLWSSALIKRDVRVLTAGGDDLTDSSDPSRKMMRQMAGFFAEYEKAKARCKAQGGSINPTTASLPCPEVNYHASLHPLDRNVGSVRATHGIR